MSPRRRIGLAIAVVVLVLGVGFVTFLISSNQAALTVAGFVATIIGLGFTAVQTIHTLRNRAPEQGTEPTRYPLVMPASSTPLGEERSRAMIAEMTVNNQEEAIRSHAPVFIELEAVSSFDAESSLQHKLDASDEPEGDLVTSIVRRSARTILLGEPGSGKSMCLSQIALQAAAEVANGGPLPFFVPLADWEDVNQPAEAFLRDQFVKQHGPDNHYARGFEAHMRRGEFLLLLDGLNEVPGRAARQRDQVRVRGSDLQQHPHRTAAEVMESFGRTATDPREQSLARVLGGHGSSSKVVVSCRTHEYDKSFTGTSTEWASIEITPLAALQIESFVRGRRPEDADAVLTTLSENPALAGLADNAFLLNSVVALPLGVLRDVRGKADLMDHLLSASIDEAKIDEPLPVRDAVERLGSVAFRMIGLWRIGNQAPMPLRTDDDRSAATLIAATPLVVELDDEYYFQHQIVQEYFAARWLSRRRFGRRPIRLLVDRRWSEIIVFWIQPDRRNEKPRAGRLTRRCLRARNLPWRRPRRSGNQAVNSFNAFVGITLIVFLASALTTALLGPATTLPFPTAWFALTPVAVVAGLFVASILGKSLSCHGAIASNAAYSLAVAGEVAQLPYVVRSFRSTLTKERSDVALSLGSVGPTLIEHGEKGLRSRSWKVRAGSVLSLGAVAGRYPDSLDRIRPLLRGAAQSDDLRLMPSTVAAIVRSGDDQLESYLDGLLSKVEQMNAMAVAVRIQPLSTMIDPVGVHWSPAVVRSLTRSLQDRSNPAARYAGLLVVDALCVPGTESVLMDLIADPAEDRGIRIMAARALGGFRSEEAGNAFLGLRSTVAPEVLTCGLRRLSPEHHLEALLEMAETNVSSVRVATATVLGSASDVRAIQRLRHLVDDESAAVRAVAIDALRHDDDAVLAAFGSAVRDTSEDVRDASLRAICSRQTKRRQLAVERIATDEGASARAAATRCLAAFGEPARPTLRNLTSSPHRKTKRAARQALRHIDWGLRRKRSERSRLVPFVGIRPATTARVAELRELFREERLAGTDSSQIVNAVNLRIMQNEQLKQRMRLFTSALLTAVMIALFLLVVVAIMVGRLGVVVAHWAWDQRLTSLALVGLCALSTWAYDRFLSNLIDIAARITLVITASFVMLLMLGIGFYLWWIPLVLLIAIPTVIALWYQAQSWRRRISRVDRPASIETTHFEDRAAADRGLAPVGVAVQSPESAESHWLAAVPAGSASAEAARRSAALPVAAVIEHAEMDEPLPTVDN